MHMSRNTGALFHSCTYRTGGNLRSLMICLVNPLVVQGTHNWFTKFRPGVKKDIFPQECNRHIVWHVQSCILTPQWRKRNTHRTLFSTGYFHPTTALRTSEKILPLKHCCAFEVNQYKFASVTLHSFLQNMSLTFVLQLAICFYYLIPTVVCLNKTVE